jgi:hypothetical protein
VILAQCDHELADFHGTSAAAFWMDLESAFEAGAGCARSIQAVVERPGRAHGLQQTVASPADAPSRQKRPVNVGNPSIDQALHTRLA